MVAVRHPTWDDIFETTRTPSPDPSRSRSAAPGWHTNDADATDFGPSRLDDDVQVVACRDCGKVVLQDALNYHHQNCALIRDVVEGRLSPSIIEGDANSLRKRRNSDVSDSSDASQSHPRKSIKDADLEAMKKAGLDTRDAQLLRKNTLLLRRKGITDVDTQCGVINDKGMPCSRSLTCKSHSMGAKRAVKGRSKPYDELLLEWQRIHNPALVQKMEEKERALAAAKAAAAERKHRKLQEKKKKKLARSGVAFGPDGQPLPPGSLPEGASANGANKALEDPFSDMYTLGFNDDDVDNELSDLVNAVRAVVQSDRTRILPMAQRAFAGVYTRRVHGLRGCRELLRQGLRSAAKASHAAAFSSVVSAPAPPSAMAAAVAAAAAAAAASASGNQSMRMPPPQAFPGAMLPPSNGMNGGPFAMTAGQM